MKLLEDRESTVLYNALDYIWGSVCVSSHNAYEEFAKVCRDIYMTKEETTSLFAAMAIENCGFFNSEAEEKEAMCAIDYAYRNGGYCGDNTGKQKKIPYGKEKSGTLRQPYGHYHGEV